MKKFIIVGLMCLMVKISFSQEQDSVKTYGLDELTISATRMNTRLKQIPQKVEIIDQTVIKSIPSENIAELLKRTTNLDIIQYPGLLANIGMRGFYPSGGSRSYTLFLINGKPSGTTNMASINTDNVLRVEVIKGPYSALYGSNAMGGVINIITKKGDAESKGGISISSGSFGSMKLSGNVSGAISEKATFALGYTRNEQHKNYRIGNHNLLKLSENEKLILNKESYGDVMQNTTYQISHLSGQLNYTLNKVWSASTEILYTFAHDVGVPANYGGLYGQNKKDINRLNLYGNLSRNRGKNSFSFSPYYTDESNPSYNGSSDTAYISFKSAVKEYGFKISDNIDFGKIKILVGVDLDVYNYTSERYTARAVPTFPYSPNYQNIKAAQLLQFSYTSGGLNIIAGERFDYIYYDIEKNDSLAGSGGTDSHQVFNPNLGIQYTFPFNLKLHGSYGTAFLVPEAIKVAGYYTPLWGPSIIKGNPDLKPERSVSYDFGMNYYLKDKLIYADITYFITKHTNKIIDDYQLIDTATYKNANDAYMDGIELILSSNVGSLFDNKFKLEVYSNITFMLKNYFNNEVNDTLKKQDILYTRKNNATFGIFFDNYKGFTSRLNARYMGSRLEADYLYFERTDITADNYYSEGGYTAADRILEHPDYLIFDFSVNYTFKENKRFGISISNLLDENYTEKDGYNMPGRFISANFAYTF